MFLTHQSLLMPAFSLAHTPPTITSRLQHMHDAPLPNTLSCCRGFGGVLKPRYIIGAEPLDQ